MDFAYVTVLLHIYTKHICSVLPPLKQLYSDFKQCIIINDYKVWKIDLLKPVM